MTYTELRLEKDQKFKVDIEIKEDPFYNKDQPPNITPDKFPFRWALYAVNNICSEFFIQH